MKDTTFTSLHEALVDAFPDLAPSPPAGERIEQRIRGHLATRASAAENRGEADDSR